MLSRMLVGPESHGLVVRDESVLCAMRNLALTWELGSNSGNLLTMNIVVNAELHAVLLYWRGNHNLGLYFWFIEMIYMALKM